MALRVPLMRGYEEAKGPPGCAARPGKPPLAGGCQLSPATEDHGSGHI